MKRLITLLLVVTCAPLFAQITGTGLACLTHYTNGVQNDTIYYYLSPELGELTATPTTGVGPYDFVWSYFTPNSTYWEPYLTQNDQAFSTILNLLPGAYNVTIYDASGNAVGCEVAWIGQYVTGDSVDGNITANITIPPSCSNIHLHVDINYQPGTSGGGPITSYSNLPPNPMLINAQTEISVCFTATHTFVSDLGFYLKGPPSCGSPTIILSPNPGSIGQPNFCNSGENVSNLCFSTESFANLDICSAAVPLSGSYGSYGASATNINWSGLYGCDATAPGWTVQIYDCVSFDVGALTDATININGINACGGNQTVTYTTPLNFNSPINDNSCTSSSASIFQVPPGTNFTPITCTYGYEWSNSLGAYMDDSLISLLGVTYPVSIDLDNVTLWTDSTMTSAYPLQNVTFTLTPFIDCNGTPDGTGCLGGGHNNDMIGDTEPFIYIPPSGASVPPMGPFCVEQGTVSLAPMPISGHWEGPGIIDPIAGIFNPAMVGAGSYVLSFIPDDICISGGSTVVDVGNFQNIFTVDPGPLCENDNPISLIANGATFFFGDGIVDSNVGIFDPWVAGPGNHLIQIGSDALCGSGAIMNIVVNPAPSISATLDSDVCLNLPTTLNASGADSYHWSPGTFLNDVNSSSPVATPTSDIIYTVVGTNAFGCSDETSVTLTIISMPEIYIDLSSVAICPGTSITLSSTGTVGTYQWSSSSGILNSSSAVVNVSPTQTTEYTVVVTDGCDISAMDAVLVEVFAPEFISAGPDVTICEGETVQLVAQTAAFNPELIWSSFNGNVPAQQATNSSIEVGTAGVYTVQLTTPEACVYQDQVTVSVSAYPVLSVSPDAEICSNQPYQLNASGASTYIWLPSSYLDFNTISNPQATISGPVTFTVTGANQYGCESEAEVTLTVFDAPTVVASPIAPVCPGSEITLSAQGSDGNYVWTPTAGVQNAYTNTATVIPDQTTTYTITLVDACGVQVSDEVEVIVEEIVDVNAGADVSYCAGASAQLLASVSGNYNSLTWTTIDGTFNPLEAHQLNLNNVLEGDYILTVVTPLACEYSDLLSVNEIALPTIYLPSTISFCPGENAVLNAGNNWDQVVWDNAINAATLETAQTGTHTVVVTENGCSNSAEVVVNQIDMPTLQLGPDVAICEDSEVTFTTPVAVAWSTGINGDHLTVSLAGTYIASYQEGACVVQDSVHVTVMPLPHLDMPAEAIGCVDEPYVLYAYQPENSYYIWSNGETTDNIVVTEFGDYTVTVGNSCGVLSATSEVRFEDCSVALYIPNTFTPDYDGINDVWKIGTYNVAKMSVQIFDRWGIPVFSSDMPDFVWTGQVNNGAYFAADGVYFFLLQFESEDGILGKREGHIVLIR